MRMLASLAVSGSCCDACGAKPSAASGEAGPSDAGGAAAAEGIKLRMCKGCKSAW
jgi:hypothetical protein